jgi:trans-2,3-dihydro-3-hydroxyanthranilate isomerase
VQVEREGAKIVFGWMKQPVPTVAPYERESELLEALGVEGAELPVEAYTNGPTHVLVRLASKEQVAQLEPDISRLGKLGAVGVYAFAGDGASWKARLFGPGLGVTEDPATGSAAGPLAVHLLRHGQTEPDTEIEIEQGTEIKRPSTLFARAAGTADQIENVEVGGQAVTVANGELQL